MIDIQWSPGHVARLGQIADKSLPVRHPMEARLAPALLLAANGLFEPARAAALGALPDTAEWSTTNPETFTYSITALFAVQCLDVAARMLCARFGPDIEIALEFGGSQPHSAVVQCDVLGPGKARFVFADSVLRTDRTHNHVLNFCWIFPLFAEYLRSGRAESGSVAINLWDAGIVPGLAFCDNRPDAFLIPDCLFVSTQGYDIARRAIRETVVPWEQRQPLALWRGSTTGQPKNRATGWRSLPRVMLSEIGRANPSLIDAGITAAVQVDSPEEVKAELVKERLWKPHLQVELFGTYKYQIDIDGNTNSWPGLFQKLLTGSPVLKIASAGGYRQWYYDRLRPWYNYVPISSDISDLTDIVRWLQAHDDVAQRIGDAGRTLAEQATYPREVDTSHATITAAIRATQYNADQG